MYRAPTGGLGVAHIGWATVYKIHINSDNFRINAMLAFEKVPTTSSTIFSLVFVQFIHFRMYLYQYNCFWFQVLFFNFLNCKTTAKQYRYRTKDNSFHLFSHKTKRIFIALQAEEASRPKLPLLALLPQTWGGITRSSEEAETSICWISEAPHYRRRLI